MPKPETILPGTADPEAVAQSFQLLQQLAKDRDEALATTSAAESTLWRAAQDYFGLLLQGLRVRFDMRSALKPVLVPVEDTAQEAFYDLRDMGFGESETGDGLWLHDSSRTFALEWYDGDLRLCFCDDEKADVGTSGVVLVQDDAFRAWHRAQIEAERTRRLVYLQAGLQALRAFEKIHGLDTSALAPVAAEPATDEAP